MESTIKKWGNNPALCIPEAILGSLGLKENDKVELYVEDDCLVIRKNQKKYEILDDLF